MPLDASTIKTVMEYCHKDLDSIEKIKSNYFKFITNSELVEELSLAVWHARHIYKLGEALNVSDIELSAHAKFQILQYSSIYEAVINFLLFNNFKSHQAVISISQYKSFKKINKIPPSVQYKCKDFDADVFLCFEKTETNPSKSIKFDSKIEAAVQIGFIDKILGDEISELFKIRNGIHIENAASRKIKYELDVSKVAFWRLKIFCLGIDQYLRDGFLDDEYKVEKKFELKRLDLARNSVVLKGK